MKSFWRIFICIIRYKFNCLEKKDNFTKSLWFPDAWLLFHLFYNFYLVIIKSDLKENVGNIPVHSKLTSQYPILVCILYHKMLFFLCVWNCKDWLPNWDPCKSQTQHDIIISKTCRAFPYQQQVFLILFRWE